MQPRPIRDGLFVQHEDGGGALIGGHCPACGRYHFPASPNCPYCSGEGCAPRPLSPRGTLCLFTSVRNRPPGYGGDVPFGFGVVELPEGLQVIARLTEADLSRLDFGMPVRLVLVAVRLDEAGDEALTYAFAPEQPA
jgi:uncharacterized OB-fold protein